MSLRELCDLIEEAGGRLTFSKDCVSGLLGADICKCWRCRSKRSSKELRINASLCDCAPGVCLFSVQLPATGCQRLAGLRTDEIRTGRMPDGHPWISNVPGFPAAQWAEEYGEKLWRALEYVNGLTVLATFMERGRAEAVDWLVSISQHWPARIRPLREHFETAIRTVEARLG